MLKSEYEACVELRNKLKERVNGKIFVKNEDGTLTISINAGKGMIYTRNINDISKRINVEDMADEIEYGYRRFISEKFFIKKEVKW